MQTSYTYLGNGYIKVLYVFAVEYNVAEKPVPLTVTSYPTANVFRSWESYCFLGQHVQHISTFDL